MHPVDCLTAPPQAVAMGTDEVVFHSARNLFMLECYCESDD